jgi:DNA-binding beta-propeller fold protein YncE
MTPAAEPAVSPPLATTPAGVTVPAGPDAEGIAVDPASATVAVGDSAGVLLFDEAGQLQHQVPLSAGPRHITVEEPGGPFLVPAQGANELAYVAPRSAVVESVVGTGRWPHDVAVENGSVFVGNELNNTVTVVRGGRVVATIPVVTQPGGLTIVDHMLAVVGVKARLLELFDVRTLHRIATASALVGPSHVAACERRLYVVDTGGGALDVFSLDPHLRQVRRISLGDSPLGIAVDPRRRLLWVTRTANNTLLEFDVSGAVPRQVAVYPVVRQPDSVAVDVNSGTVFVAGAASGALEILAGFGREADVRR